MIPPRRILLHPPVVAPLSRVAGAYRASGKRLFSTKSTSPFERYNELLTAYPLATKSITSGVICASGDAACQLIQKNDDGFDVARTSRFAFLGSFLLAPVLSFWYGKLGLLIPGTSIAPVLKRLALDQLFFAPLFIPTFMSSLMLLEEGPSCTPAIIMERLRISWQGALVANWMIWVPANLVNFKFIPGAYQVLFANCVGFVWNAVLSFQATRTS